MFYSGFISTRLPTDNLNLVHIPCDIFQDNNKIEIIAEGMKIIGRRYKKHYVLTSEFFGTSILQYETLHNKKIASLAGYWIKNSKSLFWRLIFKEQK
jgi:hypothetical protein